MWVAYNANVLSWDLIFVNRRKGYHIQSSTAVTFAVSFLFFSSVFDQNVLAADKHWFACNSILSLIRDPRVTFHSVNKFFGNSTLKMTSSSYSIKYSFLIIIISKLRFHQAVSKAEFRLKVIQRGDIMELNHTQSWKVKFFSYRHIVAKFTRQWCR